LEIVRKWDRKGWIAIGLVGLMGIVLFFGLRQHSSAFDDAYITYRYARNVALGRGFVYNVGEPVLGTTTPLYTLLLAALSFIWPDIPRLSHAIGVLAWMMCVPVVYGIASAAGRATAVGLAAAALVAFNTLFLSVLGMETSVYVLLALSTFYFYLGKRSVAAAVCAGLAFLTRWDGILVVIVFLFAEMLRGRGQRLLRAGFVCACLIVPWLVYSYLAFGSIFPNSFFAKMGQGWNQTLGGAEIGPFGRGLLTIASSAFEVNRLFALMPLFGVIGLVVAVRKRVAWWPLLLWTTAYFAGYIVLGVLRFPWYYPPLAPTLALLTAEGIRASARAISRRLEWSAGHAVLTIILFGACFLPNVDWLVKSQRSDMDAHSATYVQVARWLESHTPADSSVALLEIGIVGFYSDRRVVDTMGLVSHGMIGHLGTWLQTLQFAVNYYWPDYVVALKGTAWGGVVYEPWFEDAYALEAQIENNADPGAPVSVYRRRDGYPPDRFALSSRLDVSFDGEFALRQVLIYEDRVRPGDDLHLQLIWEALADVSRDYRFQFDLLNASDGQRWTLASRLQPMRGGNPTTQWQKNDTVIDAHTLGVPEDVPHGSYLLQLTAVRKGGSTMMADSMGNPVGHVVAGPIHIGDASVDKNEPIHPALTTFADHVSLAGYDLSYAIADNVLSITLYWQATGDVAADYTAFVHLVSSAGELVAQHDSPPNLSTSLWLPGVPVADTHTLTLPAELPPGDYEVRLGLYHWPDLERVPVVVPGCRNASDDALLLAYISSDHSPRLREETCPYVHQLEE